MDKKEKQRRKQRRAGVMIKQLIALNKRSQCAGLDVDVELWPPSSDLKISVLSHVKCS